MRPAAPASGYLCLCLAILLPPAPAAAAPDEIQVYVDDIKERGQSGVEVHVNYPASARRYAEYPGEQAPYRVLRVTPEFSFGLGHDWDWGIYVPMSIDTRTGSSFSDGIKFRVKHLVNDEREGASEFYGVNLEIGRAARRVSPSDWDGELRGIVGMRRGPWLLAVNPILSAPLSSSVSGSTVDLEFNLKLSREVREGLALGVEHYAELGPVSNPTFGPESAQSTYLALDLERKGWDLNFGIGHGWQQTDRRVLKLILGIPF